MRAQGSAEDKTQQSNGIVHDDKAENEMEDHRAVEDNGEEENFGGFDDEEDEEYVQRALKKQLRKKGIDPKATKSKAV